MRVEQTVFAAASGISARNAEVSVGDAQLVLLFGGAARMQDLDLAGLRALYPHAVMLGCSTAGEVAGPQILDDSVVLTAVHFDATKVRSARVMLSREIDSKAAGRRLASELLAPDLVHVFVLSDGLCVNGSDLVEGLASVLPSGVAVTGGLSADGSRFGATWVVLDGPARQGMVAAVGLYGSSLRVGFGSLGGWDAFGPERVVTRAAGNILYELDGQSALALYKRYLGDYAKELPSSALLFPLFIRDAVRPEGVVRTILGVDEKTQSMVFAGDVPLGARARLMKANFDRLIDGAMGAARRNVDALRGGHAQLAILISCVGRRLVLGQRTEEEVEAVRDVLGPQVTTCGFYSYGEISPLHEGAGCDLHNQTMTVTTFSEP